MKRRRRSISRNNDVERIEKLFDSMRKWVEKRFDRVDEKFDRLGDRLDKVDVTLAKQQTSLDEHIRRTEILESQVEPLKAQSAQVKLVLKIVAALVAAGGAGIGLKELVGLVFGLN